MFPQMPFGKYKGEYLQDIPTDYLQWLWRTVEFRQDWLRRAVQEELEARERRQQQQQYQQQSTNQSAAGPAPGAGQQNQQQTVIGWEAVVKKWYAELCLKHHPDRGGTHAGMVIVNEARDRLLALFRQLWT
jgi:hypothetical protein